MATYRLISRPPLTQRVGIVLGAILALFSLAGIPFAWLTSGISAATAWLVTGAFMAQIAFSGGLAIMLRRMARQRPAWSLTVDEDGIRLRRAGKPERRLARADIVAARFSAANQGGMLVSRKRGNWIQIPAGVHDIMGLRQELLALGVPVKTAGGAMVAALAAAGAVWAGAFLGSASVTPLWVRLLCSLIPAAIALPAIALIRYYGRGQYGDRPQTGSR